MGRAVAVMVGGVLVVAAVGWLRPTPGRYQLATDLRGQVTRLDTQTGRLEVFVVGPEGALEPLDAHLARARAAIADAATRRAVEETAIQVQMTRMLAAGRRRPTTPRAWAALREAAEFEAAREALEVEVARERAAAASPTPRPRLGSGDERPPGGGPNLTIVVPTDTSTHPARPRQRAP